MTSILLATVVNIDIVYIIFNLLLLFTFIIAGSNVSSGKTYWGNALLCGFVFILIIGTRYNRGIDYPHYVEVYSKNMDIDQPYFTLFNSFLKSLFVGRYFIFYIYAVPFIVGAFRLIHNYKRYSKWLFPLFIVCMQFFEEEFPRQAFSFSFVFFFIDEYINEKHNMPLRWLLCTIYSFLVISMHTANILFIILFLFLSLRPKQVFSYKLTIPVLIFAVYFFVKYYDISYISPILYFMGGLSPKFNHYVAGDASEAWFGESAMQLENARNPIIMFFEIIANSSLFYFSSKLIKNTHGNIDRKMKTLVVITNLYIIGYILRNAFLYFELINRMASLLQRMWFLPFAYVIITIRYNKLKLYERFAYFSLFFLFYDYLKYLFAPRSGMTMFLWDM